MTEEQLVKKIHRELILALRILENSRKLRQPGVRALQNRVSQANCYAMSLYRRFEGEPIPRVGD